MLKTKSVKSPIDRKGDGLRILATRTRGRGLRASRYDVWMACLGPSDRIRSRRLREKITWKQFATAYRRELEMDGPIDTLCDSIKNHGQKFTLRLLKFLSRRQNVTLMCHCAEDQRECHRHVLLKYLKSSKI